MSKVFYAKNGTAYTKDENGKPKFISKEEAQRLLEMIEAEENLVKRTNRGFIVLLITSVILLGLSQVSL